MNEPEKMGPNTESVYWMMLVELESKLKDNDIALKNIIEVAYRHWNYCHPDQKPKYASFSIS